MVKNNSQGHTEGTRTLSKITQVEIVNSLQQWFLFHDIIFFTLANYIQTIPQNYCKCKNVKNIHKHIHKLLCVCLSYLTIKKSSTNAWFVFMYLTCKYLIFNCKQDSECRAT